MEIRNEVREKDEKKQFVQRSLADIQRARLNKLMENPEKPVVIPDGHRKEKEYAAPSFIRNVMGSSAGAGSGEFHVYRHLRRKEYARQKHMKAQTEQERLDQEFQQKLEENQRIAEERTNKKRQKRLKKKKKGKKPKLQDSKQSNDDQSEDEKSTAEEDEEEDEDTKDKKENSEKLAEDEIKDKNEEEKEENRE